MVVQVARPLCSGADKNNQACMIHCDLSVLMTQTIESVLGADDQF